MLPRTVLVCFAVSQEAKYFSPPSKPDCLTEKLVTGMGRVQAGRAVRQRLDKEPVALVLTCGFAGGLRPDLAVGSVVYSEDAEAGLGGVLKELGANPAIFHCSDRIASTAVEKRSLAAATHADAVEMESEIVRKLCRERRVPSATIRVISDGAEEDLPLDFNAFLNARCELNYGKLIWAVLRSPRTVGRLLQFQRQTQRAAQELGRVLNALLRRGGLASSGLG